MFPCKTELELQRSDIQPLSYWTTITTFLQLLPKTDHNRFMSVWLAGEAGSMGLPGVRGPPGFAGDIGPPGTKTLYNYGGSHNQLWYINRGCRVLNEQRPVYCFYLIAYTHIFFFSRSSWDSRTPRYESIFQNKRVLLSLKVFFVCFI